MKQRCYHKIFKKISTALCMISCVFPQSWLASDEWISGLATNLPCTDTNLIGSQLNPPTLGKWNVLDFKTGLYVGVGKLNNKTSLHFPLNFQSLSKLLLLIIVDELDNLVKDLDQICFCRCICNCLFSLEIPILVHTWSGSTA